MLLMVIFTFTINKDIIKEYQNKSPQIGSQHFVHKSLKNIRGVTKCELHNNKLIVSFMSSKSNLINIIISHVNLVITDFKSSLEKITTPPNSSNNSSIIGIGNLSGTIILLIAL